MYNDVPNGLLHLAAAGLGGAAAGHRLAESEEQAWAFERKLSSSLSYVFVVGPATLPEWLTAGSGKVLILLRP